MSSAMENAYEILGCETGASEDEVKKAYKVAALKHHPDRNRNDPKAADKFDEIKQARDVLLDPKSRLALDSLINAKKQREMRFSKLDANRQARKTDLEEREAAAKKHFVEVRIAKRKKDEELARLKAEGRKRMRLDEDACDPDRQKAVHEGSANKKPATLGPASEPLLLKWSKKHRGALSNDDLRRHLELAGALIGDFEIDMIVVKEKSAVVTFRTEQQREVALNWLKLDSNRKVTGIKIDVVGLATATPAASEPVPAPPEAQPPAAPSSSFDFSAAPAGDDYENLTMMRMRQAAERQRLAAQIAAEDSDDK